MFVDSLIANQENIPCNFLLFIFRFSATKWTSQEGRLQCMKELAAKYEGEVAMSSKTTQPNIANPVVQVLEQRHCTRSSTSTSIYSSSLSYYCGMSKPAATPYTEGKPPPYYPPFLCRKTIPHFVQAYPVHIKLEGKYIFIFYIKLISLF